MAKTGILLESGTNEIEIMQFTIAGELYGINVAKVKEIMMAEPVKMVPLAHPAVEGIFKPRDTMLTVIDLPLYLTNKEDRSDSDLFVITSFNKLNIAFRVNTVIGISRISWEDISKPDATICRDGDSVTTGIAQCDGKLVTILDFEKIVAEIAPDTSIQMSEIEALGQRSRKDETIVLAEDSVMLSKMIQNALTRAGYIKIKSFNNGQEAWDYLKSIEDCDNLEDEVSLIITDIEMPKMDGHRLTKLVKSHARLRSIPVVIFSSLITPEMSIKCKQVGADDQLSKPEIGHLVEVIDELIERKNSK